MLKGVVYKNNAITLLALSDFGKITEFPIIDNGSIVGNVYLATVTDILPDNSVFMDIGDQKVIVKTQAKDMASPGKRYYVQLTRNAYNGKKAAATLDVNINGVYMLLTVNKKGIAFAKNFTDEQRRLVMAQLEGISFDKYGVFIKRTTLSAPIGLLALEWQRLLSKWQESQELAKSIKKSGLVMQGKSFYAESQELLHRRRINSVVTNDEEFYNLYKAVFDCKLITEDGFAQKYKIIEGIDNGLACTISLENGANIVFDHTEALIAVDVNVSGAKLSSNSENDLLQTNLLAVQAILSHVKLARLGSLMVVDFINMKDKANMQSVYNALKQGLAELNMRARLTQISSFGLVEIALEKCYEPLNALFLTATRTQFGLEWHHADLYFTLK